MMSCDSLRSLLDTYLDGELSSEQTLELQGHLDTCADCTETIAFMRAMRQGAQRAVQRDSSATEAFRAQLTRALRDEAEAERHAVVARRSRRWWRGSAPRMGAGMVAVAAAVVLWMGPRSVHTPRERESVPAEQQASLAPEDILDRMIDYHTAPPKPQVTEPKLLPELERDVGVRVPLPSLVQYGAEWQGGSVVRVRRDQPAAYLRYRTRDHHSVTVYVYNASRIPLHASLKPRMFREEPVYQGNWRGYSIAAQLRRGVGYAVTTDMDESRSAELVRTISTGAELH
jgi:anti-sigma factor RsiW